MDRTNSIKYKIQLVLAVYCCIVAMGTVILYPTEQYPFYMTFLSFWMLTMYMCLYYTLPNKVKDVMYGFLLMIHIIVPLAYWILLNGLNEDNRPESIVWNYFIHGSDFVVIFIHFFLFKNPYPLTSVLWNLIIMIIYIFWAFIGYGITGKFVYPFLSFQNEMAKYLYPGIFIGSMVISLAWFKIHQFKNKKTTKRTVV